MLKEMEEMFLLIISTATNAVGVGVEADAVFLGGEPGSFLHPNFIMPTPFFLAVHP